MTDEGKLLLVEQYRPPVAARVIELPAGLAGDGKFRHETLEAAARRELLEETGYEAGEMSYVGGGPASAGLTNELISIFVATNVHKAGPALGDGDEQITVHEVPLNELVGWLESQSQAGLLIDLKVYTAMHFLTPGR